MSYTFFFSLSCKESANTQDEICDDFGGVLSERDIVTCKDMEGEVLYSKTVSVGDSITVPGSGNGPLPEVLICEITSVENRSLRQIFQVNTSGDKVLILKLLLDDAVMVKKLMV